MSSTATGERAEPAALPATGASAKASRSSSGGGTMEWKSLIVSGIWGFSRSSDQARTNRLTRLETYFQYFQDTFKGQDIFRDEILLSRYVKLLQSNPDTPRRLLRVKIVGEHSEGVAKAEDPAPQKERGAGPGNPQKDSTQQDVPPTPECTLPQRLQPVDFLSRSPNPSLNQQDKTRLFNSNLAATVRAMFALIVSEEPDYREGSTCTCVWEENESLKQFLERELGLASNDDSHRGRLKERLLSLRNLVTHADITVAWTSHLPDHLLLKYEKSSKKLHIFNLPSFIEVTLEASKEAQSSSKNYDLCYGTKDKKFVYSAKFMLEMYHTYRLLVPYQDAEWVRKTFLQRRDSFCTRLLRGKGQQTTKDSRLTEIFKGSETDPSVGNRLTTYLQLYQRFPHWALRLQCLMDEAEDPTPMSWNGRWAERRKGPRHSFWVTVVALVIVILFGIVTTTFAIMQFALKS